MKVERPKPITDKEKQRMLNKNRKLIEAIERAHKDAANSKLKFP